MKKSMFMLLVMSALICTTSCAGYASNTSPTEKATEVTVITNNHYSAQFTIVDYIGDGMVIDIDSSNPTLHSHYMPLLDVFIAGVPVKLNDKWPPTPINYNAIGKPDTKRHWCYLFNAVQKKC